MRDFQRFVAFIAALVRAVWYILANKFVLQRTQGSIMWAELSDNAWEVLDQLKSGPVWDGDLIAKSGRNQLLSNGYSDKDSKGNNFLTERGRELAAVSDAVRAEQKSRELKGEPAQRMPIGERIRALREKRGYSLAELAKMASSSKGYIWDLETKPHISPSADKLMKIASALGVTTGYFLADEAEEDSVDAAFYQRYLRLSPADRVKLRKLVDVVVG